MEGVVSFKVGVGNERAQVGLLRHIANGIHNHIGHDPVITLTVDEGDHRTTHTIQWDAGIGRTNQDVKTEWGWRVDRTGGFSRERKTQSGNISSDDWTNNPEAGETDTEEGQS